jgi:hypothetical protein
VGVEKKGAIALADIFDKKIDERSGPAHTAHSTDINALSGVDGELVAGDTIPSN